MDLATGLEDGKDPGTPGSSECEVRNLRLTSVHSIIPIENVSQYCAIALNKHRDNGGRKDLKEMERPIKIGTCSEWRTAQDANAEIESQSERICETSIYYTKS